MLWLANEPRRTMTFQIATRGDALRHTVRRVAVAVSLTVVMVTVTTLLHLGTDFDASVRVGDVMFNSICAASGDLDPACGGTELTDPRC